MSAPKGNTSAVGHGRPHKKDFSDDECIALGERLLAWMKEMDDDKKSNVVHLSEFFCKRERISPSYWYDCLARRDCFSDFYREAMAWMGERLLKNQKLAPSYGNRFLPIYFKEVKKEERETFEHQEDYKAKKKKDEESLDIVALKAQMDQMMQLIATQQRALADAREQVSQAQSARDQS